jgi:hypothetical protein
LALGTSSAADARPTKKKKKGGTLALTTHRRCRSKATSTSIRDSTMLAIDARPKKGRTLVRSAELVAAFDACPAADCRAVAVAVPRAAVFMASEKREGRNGRSQTRERKQCGEKSKRINQ